MATVANFTTSDHALVTETNREITYETAPRLAVAGDTTTGASHKGYGQIYPQPPQ